MPDRVAHLGEKIRELNLEAFVISSLTNLRYLTGFTGSNAIAVFTQSNIFLITDKRYREQADAEAQNAEVIICAKNLYQPIKDHKLFKQCKRIAFEACHLSFRAFSHLQKIAEKVQFVATENLIEKITATKEPEEIEKISNACDTCAKLWQHILPMLCVGMAELDIAAEIAYQAHKHGADGVAFEPIVASGWRAALPHGKASPKKIQKGELVVVDFGCEVGGFKSDVTRTIAFGEPTHEQQQVYGAVKDANAFAFESIIPNMKAVDLDKAVRDRLIAAGYQEQFSHSLGHGLGLGIHELPRIGENSKDSIPPFSVFTIEPGVYIPGFGGVRIEDDVVVTKSGPKLLSKIDRDLSVIE
ncbi:MAG: M24 family metallopeptidase [bacterium]